MKSKYHWDETDLVITSDVEKHLGGKHDQSTHAGNKKGGATTPIRQKKMTGYWGYSRTGSTSIATASRDIMGIPSRVNVASRNLSETDYEQAEIALDNISSRPTMVSVPLAHTTSRMPELESVQAGSVIKLGLTATAKHKVGEYDQGYAEDYISEMQVLVFTGTKPTHLYSGRRNAPEEAIVAGEFKVVGKETVDVPRSRFRNGVYESWTGKATVVQLEQVSTFDTTTKAFVPFKSSVEKHLGGKHDQKTHAGRRGAVDLAVASGGSTKATTPKAPKKTARQKEVDSLTLGVDYDSEGYPLDDESGIVAQKLAEVHGLYDEASDAAMAIAERGPKKLLMPRDENGLPQVLPLDKATKRYGGTPQEVIKHVEENFGVKIVVSGRGKGEEHQMDMLHGVAQAIEELKLNGIPIDKMTNVVRVNMSPNVSRTVVGFWAYGDRSITINANNIPTGASISAGSVLPPARYFGASDAFVSVGFNYGEGAVRNAYGTFIHESGHAMDNYVGRQIQETRKKIINETFAGTGLLRPDWETTPRGQSILYNLRDVNATTYYGDIGAQGLVATRRDGTIDVQAYQSGMVGNKVSFSGYATYNLRENFSETLTAYWLYGGSKGAYKNYYDQYIDRVGNIVEMSQGIIKVVNPANSDVIVTDLALLSPSHPLIVWITGIVPS